jgi:hypothetical protein
MAVHIVSTIKYKTCIYTLVLHDVLFVIYNKRIKGFIDAQTGGWGKQTSLGFGQNTVPYLALLQDKQTDKI